MCCNTHSASCSIYYVVSSSDTGRIQIIICFFNSQQSWYNAPWNRNMNCIIIISCMFFSGPDEKGENPCMSQVQISLKFRKKDLVLHFQIFFYCEIQFLTFSIYNAEKRNYYLLLVSSRCFISHWDAIRLWRKTFSQLPVKWRLELLFL